MTIRELTFPKDFDAVLEIATESFQYPENPEWSIQDDESEGLDDSARNLSRMWPIINILKVFSPSLQDIFRGHIWEEGGKAAGLVMVNRRGSTNKWWVATVAVHPDFRRRGIARKLVNASLDLMRSRGAQIAILDVIAGNVPAYELYTSLGFEHFSSNIDMEFKIKEYPKEPLLPQGYILDTFPFSEWKLRYDLDSKIFPDSITRYEPVEIGRYKRPFVINLVLPIIIKAQGVRENRFVIRTEKSGETVARFDFDERIKPGGRHSFFVRLDPAHGHLADFILGFLLNQVAQTETDQYVNFIMPQWQPDVVTAATKVGFEDRVEFHRLGLVL